MDRDITNMIKEFLDEQKKETDIIHTREGLAMHIGISHATLYSRLADRSNWEKCERVALSEIIPVTPFDSNDVVTKMVLKYLKFQANLYREKVMTREKFAEAIGIPISTLYNRFNRGGWKEEEIIKIHEICLSVGGSENFMKNGYLE